MPFKVIPDKLQAAANHSRHIENVGVTKCPRTFWPIIKCGPAGDRLPVTLTGSNYTNAVYGGEGTWSIAGQGITLYPTQVGGHGVTQGQIKKLPLTLFAEGTKRGSVDLTWALKPAGQAQLIRNPAVLKLHAVEPTAVITLSTRTIAVKGKACTLTLDANLPFDQGTLTIVKGASSITLRHKGAEVRSLTFKARTELQVEARQASELDGVVFQWQVNGIAGTGQTTLTVVEGVLSIFDIHDAAIVSKRRVLHKNRSRAKLTVACKPTGWKGSLKLVASAKKVLFFSKATGDEGKAESPEIAASGALATLYVQGIDESKAAWDTELRLGLVGLADAVDKATLTVVQTSLAAHAPRPGPKAPDAKVSDFGSAGPSPPAFGPSQESATTYCQGFPRSLVRVGLLPLDAPCKLVVRLAQDASQCQLFPEGGSKPDTSKPVPACITHGKPLEILAGAIKSAQDKRTPAAIGRYGKEGLVLWAEGLSPTSKGSLLQVDVDGVDQGCASLTLKVERPHLRVSVAREDKKDLSADVAVTITPVGSGAPQHHTIPAKQGHVDVTPDVGSYRIALEPKGVQEKGLRVLLEQPATLPIDVVGPLVEAKFLLAKPYQRIQFIGYKVHTGSYKGLDSIAVLSPQQEDEAKTQAKSFARAAALNVLDLRCADPMDTDAEHLRDKLQKQTYDQICANPQLFQDVRRLTTIDLKQQYARELDGVKRDLGRRQGVQDDIARRCGVMLDVIHNALGDGKTKDKLPEVEAGDDVLKVFMAPEFFFRGQQGAYPVETLHEILPALSALDDKHFKNCLFVLGSAIGYREREPVVVGKPVAGSAKTVVGVKVAPTAPAALLADGKAGWTLTAGGTTVPIDEIGAVAPDSTGLLRFLLTVQGQVCYGPTDLSVWNPAHTKVTPTGVKNGCLEFAFAKDHKAQDMSTWTLKLRTLANPKGSWSRFALSDAQFVDKRRQKLTLDLPTSTTLGIFSTDARITAGKWHSDHRGTIVPQCFEVPLSPNPGSFASKWQPSFELSIPGVGAFPVQGVGTDVLRFDASHEPTWTSILNWDCGPADHKCPVQSGGGKRVEITLEFLNRDFPDQRWTFRQGTVKGPVVSVTPGNQKQATLVLAVPADRSLNLHEPIEFLRSCFSVEIFNVAFVRKGGVLTPVSADGSAAFARLVEKEHISSVDYEGPTFGDFAFYERLQHFIKLYNTQAHATPTDGSLSNRDQAASPALENASNRATEKSASGLGGGSLFDMDGLSYGLEVCLDHGEGRLSKSGAARVRVQLIPSCGMSITPGREHIDTGKHSYIFNVDGQDGARHSKAKDKSLNDVPGVEYTSAVANWSDVLTEAGWIVVHDVGDL